jgi:hypothetical protein
MALFSENCCNQSQMKGCSAFPVPAKNYIRKAFSSDINIMAI